MALTDRGRQRTGSPRRSRYPPVDRDDVVDVLHGVPFADPYRYLEDPDDERTRAFVAAQNAVSQPYLAALPAAARSARGPTALLAAPRRGAPWERGGRYFVLGNPGELDQDLLYTADSLDDLLDDPQAAARPQRAVRRRHGGDDGGAGQPGRVRSSRTRCPRRIRLAHDPGAGRRLPARTCPTS